jgi:hypothetical protein
VSDLRDKMLNRNSGTKPQITAKDVYYLCKMAAEMLDSKYSSSQTIHVASNAVGKDACMALRSLYVALKKYRDPLTKSDLLSVAKAIYEQGPAERIVARSIIWELRSRILREVISGQISAETGPLVMDLSEYFPDAFY